MFLPSTFFKLDSQICYFEYFENCLVFYFVKINSINSIKIIFTVIEKNMIPKSRNNGNDCDYIYLDMLNGDDAKYLFSFENKKISNIVRQ